ncbi:DUF2726 domain-containing protein [Aquabacterium fontiphilum]|uniref:DUF2726 domain-containing protein n=1 Tax=Aquabacterium fontiphilum TaxID=450365 RepID=UPI0013781D18|nr:DUF2726 domain-containing protein [Aquabacterium fontiphilum]NBD20914.1 DUF2726 domain-containing protein [Aquabacterium fontiphilum]
MDMISMWPLVLAATLGSAGLAGAWWYQRSRVRAHGADAGARVGRVRGRRRPRRATTAHDDALDTLAAWEPVATRVLKTPEREAYQVLRRALPDHIILAQVPLARFIKVPTRNSYSEWLRRVGSLCADLVVCDMSSQVVAVVEVRPGAGGSKDNALKRQARMDKVLQAARIPVHVWLEGALPGPAVAREAILGAAIQTSGRAGYADLSVARRDAQAAAVVAAMQAPEAAALPMASGAAVGGEGMDVRESPLDFDIDAWMRSAQPDEAEGDETAASGEPAHREPPPSTWFDDLDTDPATGLVPETPMSGQIIRPPMFEDRPQVRPQAQSHARRA